MIGNRVVSGALAGATALVILGVSALPLATTAWYRFEQDRTGVAALSGFSPAELDTVTGALVADVALWSGDFDVALGGVPVLNERERSHLYDVRGVLAGFEILILASLVALAVAYRRARSPESRARLWRAIARGATGMAIAVAVVGLLAVFAFDAAFAVMHRLFFSAGTFTFDPATERLTQLFPEALWSDTAMVLGGVALGVAVLTAWLASGRARAARTEVRAARTDVPATAPVDGVAGPAPASGARP